MTEDRSAAGVEHLQQAALEMIQAARAFLDVIEEVVADRDKVADVVAAVGNMAEAAGRAARSGGHGWGPDPSTGPPPDDGKVQHIRVS